MNMIKAGLFAATLSAVVASGAGVAAAAPSGSPDALPPATFDCGSAGGYTGFANSGNSQALTWNPFFLTGAGGQSYELVLTANDLVLTDSNGLLFAPDATKGGAPGAVTCTVSGTIDSPALGTITVSGSVTGNLLPA